MVRVEPAPLPLRPHMVGPVATCLFRSMLALAGVYNLVFGLWAGLQPGRFFELLELAPPRYPQIWACLGMVVGVYGLLYLYAAWRPERARAIVAVGLLGKVLGPIGMVWSFGDVWPQRVGLLCVFNDLVWWLPFTLFLIRGRAFTPSVTRWAPWVTLALHGLGSVALALVLRHGVEAESDLTKRIAYIAAHPTLWIVSWTLLMLSALSIVGLYAWWAARVLDLRLAVTGVLLAALGTVFDLWGEAVCILVLGARAPELVGATGEEVTAFGSLQASVTVLSAGIANGLYTAGGFLLFLGSRAQLPVGMRRLMAVTWVAGASMTVAALASWDTLLMLTSALLFPSLLAWNAWLAVYFGRAPAS